MNCFSRICACALVFNVLLMGCASTSSNGEEKTADNTSWQKNLIRKFSFHTASDHREARKKEEEYERKHYNEKKSSNTHAFKDRRKHSSHTH